MCDGGAMKHKICTYCNKPIVLVPSASDRASKYGQSPEYYRSLFTVHGKCQVEMRKESTSQLIERNKGK